MQNNRYRVSAEELEIAKHTDLPALLESLGYHVTKKGRYHSTTEMDSLRIKNRRTWFRYSEQVGGDAIAFLQHFHGMEFVDATKRLREGGYITMDSDSLITLTDSGMEIAERIYTRHKTLTAFFVHLGVDEKTAREDACKVEHDLSQQTYDALCRHAGKMAENR